MHGNSLQKTQKATHPQKNVVFYAFNFIGYHVHREYSRISIITFMRYLLIDKIISIEPNKRIRAIKTVSLSEDIFLDHFPGNPVMPGALMIESAAQAGTALIEISASLKKKAFLVMVQDAKFRSLVRPGKTLTLDLNIVSIDDLSALTECEIVMNSPGEREERVAAMTMTFGIRPDRKSVV